MRLACVQSAIQPVWEGLAEHRWTAPQLQGLQARFERYDFLTDLKRPLEGERAAAILTADLLYTKKARLSDLVDTPGSGLFGWTVADLFGRLAPHGWYYQEQLKYCRLFEDQLEGTASLFSTPSGGTKPMTGASPANRCLMKNVATGFGSIRRRLEISNLKFEISKR